jgi:hypothetical protein
MKRTSLLAPLPMARMSPVMTPRKILGLLDVALVHSNVAMGPSWAGAGSGGVPSLDSPGMGQGPGSLMRMTLQKTFLKINVATIDVRFDRVAQARFAELTRGK